MLKMTVIGMLACLLLMATKVNAHVQAIDDLPLTEEMEKLSEELPVLATKTGKDYCPLCEAIVTDLLPDVNNKTDVAFAEAFLKQKCADKFPGDKDAKLREICDAAAAFILKKVIGMVNGDINKKWDVPHVFCADLKVCKIDCCVTDAVPEQVHLSFNDTWSGFQTLRVTWSTLVDTPNPVVQYTLADGEMIEMDATTHTYTAGGWNGSIHSSIMMNLPASSHFTYRVGNGTYWSKYFTVYTPPTNTGVPGGRPTRVGQIADMGTRSMSNNTIASLKQLVAKQEIDFILHIGDISYADGNQHRWDMFMRKVEDVAAVVPYMVVPGNHESSFNFAAYRARFAFMMPAINPYAPIVKGTWWWNEGYYDFTVGGISFVMLDAEVGFGNQQMSKPQIAWADAALGVAAKRRADGHTPWVIAAHHRPLYCTNLERDCNEQFAGQMRGYVEDILVKHDVDLDLCGHMHSYERMYPTINSTVENNGSYVDPKAPVYIVNGAAGNEEANTLPSGNMPYSAFQSSSVGYAIFSTEANATTRTLRYTFYNSATNDVIDHMTITKGWKI